MSTISLVNLNKIYDNGFHAVHDFNLEINNNEFVVLVGPSGCGKSTTLRMIAGLEPITAGSLLIDGKKVNNLSPKERGIAMVFQSYALYPTMNVYDNLAFGLKLQEMDTDEIEERVNKTAKTLGLEEYLQSKPRELSGGQRQRVALGRAMARDSKVYLMDEPLSNLDANLRVQMRTEIKLLHEKANAPTVYVTHDQIEALTLADRIVIMNKGRIQQIGTPVEVYEHPYNLFVASFIGMPPMNFYPITIVSENTVDLMGTKINVGDSFGHSLNAYLGKEMILGVRPEHICLTEQGADMTVQICEKLGSYSLIHGTIHGKKTIIKAKDWIDFPKGTIIRVTPDWEQAHLFDAKTTIAVGRESK